MKSIRRAILSVTDKRGIVALAQGLHGLGIELLSTGGTEAVIREAGIPVRSVADVTGMPEMLGGRVKTLHPKILGGVLARRERDDDRADLETHQLSPIDLVVVNLYAFEQTTAREGTTLEQAIENIDIGGPTLIRSAAKNWAHVGVVTDPDDYPRILEELKAGQGLSRETRLWLAQKAFARTAAYDSAIAHYLGTPAQTEPFPPRLTLSFERVQPLRYGENPHQTAAFYRDPRWKEGSSLADVFQHGGKELSYNNLLDLDAAFRIVVDLEDAAAVIIKHGNPAGASSGHASLRTAFDRALAGDTLSAFGGVIGLSRIVDLSTAEAIAPHFFEAVLAPGYEPEALELLTRKKNLRVLSLPGMSATTGKSWDLRRISGGLLVQTWDRELAQNWKVATRRAPTEQEWKTLRFAWTLCEHVKSNAIVFAQPGELVGAGAGQMSRVDSVHLAARKAGERARGAVMASDAFFPFPDGVLAAVEAGITAVIQPGGSIKDADVLAAADQAGIAMILTGIRHFKH